MNTDRNGSVSNPKTSPSSGSTLITGDIVTMDEQNTVYKSGYIAIRDGRISAVGPGTYSGPECEERIDSSSQIVLPGFVNTHAHLSTRLNHGLNTEQNLGINYTKGTTRERLYEAQDTEECYAGALLSIVELLRSGVTTTTDSQSMWSGMRKADGSLRAIHESGMRCLFSTAFVDKTEIVPSRHHYSVAHAVEEYLRVKQDWEHGRVRIIPEALSLPRASDALIGALVEAGEGHLAMHMSYAPEFSAWSQHEFGCDPVERLDQMGYLGPNFLGSHPVHMSDNEIELYAAAEAKAAYCAVVNMFMGSAHLDLGRFHRAGIATGLGIDSGHGNNFFETMKISVFAQKQLHSDGARGQSVDALRWGTIDGARALGMERSVGSLEVGKEADIQILDGRTPELAPGPGSLRLLVFGAGPEAVRDVMIGGKWVMRNRVFINEVLNNAVEIAAEAQKRVMQAADYRSLEEQPRGWRTMID